MRCVRSDIGASFCRFVLSVAWNVLGDTSRKPLLKNNLSRVNSCRRIVRRDRGEVWRPIRFEMPSAAAGFNLPTAAANSKQTTGNSRSPPFPLRLPPPEGPTRFPAPRRPFIFWGESFGQSLRPSISFSGSLFFAILCAFAAWREAISYVMSRAKARRRQGTQKRAVNDCI